YLPLKELVVETQVRVLLHQGVHREQGADHGEGEVHLRLGEFRHAWDLRFPWIVASHGSVSISTEASHSYWRSGRPFATIGCRQRADPFTYSLLPVRSSRSGGMRTGGIL